MPHNRQATVEGGGQPVTLPKLRGGWFDIERYGVGCIRLQGMVYVSLKKVAFALRITEKELCAKIVASGAEKYPPPPELVEGP